MMLFSKGETRRPSAREIGNGAGGAERHTLAGGRGLQTKAQNR